MSIYEHQTEATDEQTDEQQEDQQAPDIEKPEVTEEHREKAKEMAKAFEDRPTVALPGSGNTVTGQAVNDWLDDDGKPIHGEVENEVERQGG